MTAEAQTRMSKCFWKHVCARCLYCWRSREDRRSQSLSRSAAPASVSIWTRPARSCSISRQMLTLFEISTGATTGKGFGHGDTEVFLMGRQHEDFGCGQRTPLGIAHAGAGPGNAVERCRACRPSARVRPASRADPGRPSADASRGGWRIPARRLEPGLSQHLLGMDPSHKQDDAFAFELRVRRKKFLLCVGQINFGGA